MTSKIKEPNMWCDGCGDTFSKESFCKKCYDKDIKDEREKTIEKIGCALDIDRKFLKSKLKGVEV